MPRVWRAGRTIAARVKIPPTYDRCQNRRCERITEKSSPGTRSAIACAALQYADVERPRMSRQLRAVINRLRLAVSVQADAAAEERHDRVCRVSREKVEKAGALEKERALLRKNSGNRVRLTCRGSTSVSAKSVLTVRFARRPGVTL